MQCSAGLCPWGSWWWWWWFLDNFETIWKQLWDCFRQLRDNFETILKYFLAILQDNFEITLGWLWDSLGRHGDFLVTIGGALGQHSAIVTVYLSAWVFSQENVPYSHPDLLLIQYHRHRFFQITIVVQPEPRQHSAIVIVYLSSPSPPGERRCICKAGWVAWKWDCLPRLLLSSIVIIINYHQLSSNIINHHQLW